MTVRGRSTIVRCEVVARQAGTSRTGSRSTTGRESKDEQKTNKRRTKDEQKEELKQA